MDPLEQLNDISLGAPIGAWPLAWGWWLIIGLILASFVLIFLLWRKRQRFNAPRREAIAEITALKAGRMQVHCLNTAINQILKRCARHYSANNSVNTLHSQQWINWLSQQLPTKHQAKFTNNMSMLASSLYAAPSIDSNNGGENNDAFKQHAETALFWLAKANFKALSNAQRHNSHRGAHV